MSLTPSFGRALLVAAVFVVGATPALAQSPQHHAADAVFMQGMIGHHAQALEMTALVVARTSSSDIRLLAERIDVSQTDEIAWMKQWLRERREPLPDPHAHHAAGHTAMPGMLSPAEMAELAAARNADFDRLFLRFMIQHHEGALVMVAQLKATPGAGQEPATAMFASEVDSDQRMEIARMRAMLNAFPDRE
jgi:uncharacterized protein (DUF305 family)